MLLAASCPPSRWAYPCGALAHISYHRPSRPTKQTRFARKARPPLRPHARSPPPTGQLAAVEPPAGLPAVPCDVWRPEQAHKHSPLQIVLKVGQARHSPPERPPRARKLSSVAAYRIAARRGVLQKHIEPVGHKPLQRPQESVLAAAVGQVPSTPRTTGGCRRCRSVARRRRNAERHLQSNGEELRRGDEKQQGSVPDASLHHVDSRCRWHQQPPQQHLAIYRYQ
jgi:hypothetical protein